jgi:hypothetical protein
MTETGTQTTAAAGAAAIPPPSAGGALSSFWLHGAQHLVYVSAERHVVEAWVDDDSGPKTRDWTALSDAPRASEPGRLASYAVPGDDRHAVYVEGDDFTWSVWRVSRRSDGSVRKLNLTERTSAVMPDESAALAGYSRDAEQHVLYVDAQHHVRELWGVGDDWHTKADESSLASRVRPAVAATLSGNQQNVVYADSHNVVSLLVLDSTWQRYELASPCSPGSALAAATLGDGAKYAAWFDRDRHLHVVSWSDPNRPSDRDVTAETGDPPALDNTRVQAVVGDAGLHVFYIDEKLRPRAAFYDHVNDHWHGLLDLTTLAGAPAAAPNSGLSAYVGEHGEYGLFYVDNDFGHIRQLWADRAYVHTKWRQRDLSAP